jgi:hypothetical protein
MEKSEAKTDAAGTDTQDQEPCLSGLVIRPLSDL